MKLQRTRQREYEDRSRRISSAIILWFAVVISGITLRQLTIGIWYSDFVTTSIVIYFTLAIGVGSLAIVLNTINYFRMLPPEIPTGRPLRNIRYEHTIRPPGIRLESIEGGRYVLGKYDFTEEQWRRIRDQVKWNGWKWNRKVLESSGVFTMAETGMSITNGNTFNETVQEMVRLKIIKGRTRAWIVTAFGKQELSRAAGDPDGY